MMAGGNGSGSIYGQNSIDGNYNNNNGGDANNVLMPLQRNNDAVVDPLTGQHLLAGRSARNLIHQRAAARMLLVLLAVLCTVALGWVLIEFAKHEKDECDVPLALYVKVWVVLWLFGVWKKELFHKILLRWSPQDGAPPFRVRLVDSIYLSAVHAWVAMGIYWVVSSETCHETASELYTAVKWWVSLQTVVLAMSSIAILASRNLISWVQNSSTFTFAEDPRVIVSRMEEVKFDPAVLVEENGEVEHCSVCQEAFDRNKTIRRTPCGHVFHEVCLATWYQRKPTCPLCRAEHIGGGGAGAVGNNPISYAAIV
eukprot:jgi/Bigna1/87622/estExt_fgenesh1_pg.C_220107